MRFSGPALTCFLVGVAAPALVAPAFAQTCACPPTGASWSGPAIQAEEPPPPLPVYEQPPIPAPGYIWTPGYWAWNNYDYYWVPGVWVAPPQPGVLWTPGYWAFVGGAYLFHQGFWGPHVGFYGGVNYGFGYNGQGYEGGRWEGGRLAYNTTVNNFGGVRITNVYTQNVVVPPGAARVSYNGGPGGAALRPTPEQERLTTEEHLRPTPAQLTHARTASMEAMQFRSANQGKPAVAATARPGDLRGPGVVPAKAAAELQPAPGPNALPAPIGAPNAERKAPAGATLAPAVPVAPLPAGLGEKPTRPEPLAPAPNAGRKAPAGATLAPAVPVAPLPPGLGEKPTKPEPLAPAPNAERKAPAGATLAPAVPVAPRPPALGEKPTKPEPPALPKPGAIEPQRKSPGAPPRPEGLERPARPEAAPNRESRAPEPQRPMPAAMAPPVERPRPELAPGGAPKGPPAAAERKPEHSEGRERACGKPGEPPCR